MNYILVPDGSFNVRSVNFTRTDFVPWPSWKFVAARFLGKRFEYRYDGNLNICFLWRGSYYTTYHWSYR